MPPRRVVPWSELGDLDAVAPLVGRAPADFRADLASLPAGLEGVALVGAEGPLAVGLWIPAGLGGRCRLTWLGASPGGAGAAAALELVAEAEARARAEGAERIEVTVRRVEDIAPLLEARGYRRSDALVRMRWPGPRPVPQLPGGTAERSLDEVGPAAWAAIANETFADVAFNVPMTAEDGRRRVADPAFDARLLRFVVDAEGVAGFLHGDVNAGGTGEVQSIGVAGRARRRGLGRWLLRRAEALLLEAGAREIVLRVAASNPEAVALYLAEGYAEVSRVVSWERPP